MGWLMGTIQFTTGLMENLGFSPKSLTSNYTAVLGVVIILDLRSIYPSWERIILDLGLPYYSFTFK